MYLEYKIKKKLANFTSLEASEYNTLSLQI